jgi:hypothetical protein
MAKSRRHRHRQRRSRSRRAMRGGYPDSAWGNVMGKVGDGWTQFQNSLTLQPGENIVSKHNNVIEPTKDINAQAAQPMLKSNMTGGKKRRTRSRRGGYWSQVINNAIVPFSLIGLQQKFGKRTRRNH